MTAMNWTRIFVITAAARILQQKSYAFSFHLPLKGFRQSIHLQTPHSQRYVQLYSVVKGTEVVPHRVLGEKICNEIEDLIQQRAHARWRGDYQNADKFRDRLSHPDLLPPGFSLQIEDIPRSQGGGSQWSLLCDISNKVEAAKGSKVLQLAHATLGLAVSSSQTRQDCAKEQEKLVEEALRRLEGWASIQQMVQSGVSLLDCIDSEPDDVSNWWAVEQELRGRKAADAAFWFAISGVSNVDIYAYLLQVGLKEIERFGHRPSCRAKDLWAVVDRFAAAGIRPNGIALQVLSRLVSSKSDHEVSIDEVMARWDLHSDSCALLVWKFSTRQRKQRDFLASAARHWQIQHSTSAVYEISKTKYNWKHMYQDPERPLIIDIGCGMGLSLLGIASIAQSEEERHQWENCNFLGVDLSHLAIGYGNSISNRWKLDKSLKFVVDAAERALDAVKSSYPGVVSQVLIQFPTPYRLLPANANNSDYQGNTQLPKTAIDGFMVSKELLELIASLLQRSNGTLLLQSNCEDVALFMYNMAVRECGMVGVAAKDIRWKMPDEITQRTETWLSLQPNEPERAIGPSWWESPVLPVTCQTETEIACRLNKTPVHRCLLSTTENPL